MTVLNTKNKLYKYQNKISVLNMEIKISQEISLMSPILKHSSFTFINNITTIVDKYQIFSNLNIRLYFIIFNE